MSQQGGVEWFCRHLELNGFDPIVFDGRDPAAFVWAILEMEQRLATAAEAVTSGKSRYPLRLPYGVAVAPKGAGFKGEGTNLAHNLPLFANPHTDSLAAAAFNDGARRLWAPRVELLDAIDTFNHYGVSRRSREREHPMAHRDVRIGEFPPVVFQAVDEHTRRDPARLTTTSPMTAVDRMFAATVRANPHLRPRVGNPDEMRSNRLLETLDLLQRDVAHRVIYLLEPGRFRSPRSAAEQRHQAPAAVLEELFPSAVLPRLFVTHTRPEAILGLLGSLHTGARTAAMGYLNRGGTLTTPGMLFVNRCTWAHVLAAAAGALDLPREALLSPLELRALDGLTSPHGIIVPDVSDQMVAS